MTHSKALVTLILAVAIVTAIAVVAVVSLGALELMLRARKLQRRV